MVRGLSSPLRTAVPLAIALASLDGAAPRAGSAQSEPGALETLKPIAALPAHIAGSFQDLAACDQTAAGEYFVFDRRAHSVFTVTPQRDGVRKLIEIGAEPGRVLAPTSFRLAADRTFVVADAPGGTPRIQVFTTSGSSLGGFYLPTRSVPRITLGNLVLSGVAALEYTGRSIFISQPENGALVTEYSAHGQAVRTFGELRRTGHESNADLHFALNSGLVVANPAGGLYFVFLAGAPQFRKYDANGMLAFERHIEGREMDPLIQNLPTTWKRHRTDAGEIPLVVPSVFAAAASGTGDLWISLAVGVTYVYDAFGDKRRVVRFHGAAPMAPTSLAFTPKGRLLAAPGCYVFAADR